jgi:Domain of unknown function (DUF5069)
MATDLREGRGFPRRGRLPAGRLLWLLRLFDKARAAANGHLGEYFYPCPIDQGMMERWGVTREQFEAAIVDNDNDEAILRWAQQTITIDGIDEANSWLVVEKFENLDRQDREEGAFDAQPA